MDTGTDLYVEAASRLRSDIEATRAALGQKFHALQEEVRDTLAEASGRMKGSIRQAREAVDPAVQFHRHPFVFCTAAFVAGIVFQQRVALRREKGDGERGGEAESASRAAGLPRRQPGLLRAVIEGAVPSAVELLSSVILPHRRP